MHEIELFLASSAELEPDRRAIELFIARQNKILKRHNIRLELTIWEFFIDAVSQTRLQDEYNKAIEACDIFIMLFFTKVGKYTAEEFNIAYNKFKRDGKPLIYTYFKNAEIKTGAINERDTESLLAFQEQLKALGHFVTHYHSIDQLNLHFLNQLQLLNFLQDLPLNKPVNAPIKKEALTLKFTDTIYPNMVSIKKLSTVDLNQTNITIKWPKVVEEALEHLEVLISAAEEADQPHSIFYECYERSVDAFYESALSTKKRVTTIIQHAPRRVFTLINGMSKRWGPLNNYYSRQVDSLKHYLLLCNIAIQSALAYTLYHDHIRADYFPKEFEVWLEYIKDNTPFIKKVFGITGELFSANSMIISGEYLDLYIWGEEAHIREAYYLPRDGTAVPNTWFSNYVIPQVEFKLTEDGSDLEIIYDGVIKISKIRDQDFNEVL